jgi:hypothetical protein
LAKIELPKDEAAAWHRDLQTARKTLKAPPGALNKEEMERRPAGDERIIA